MTEKLYFIKYSLSHAEIKDAVGFFHHCAVRGFSVKTQQNIYVRQQLASSMFDGPKVKTLFLIIYDFVAN